MKEIEVVGLPALLHVPPGTPPEDGWPGVLFLHGILERGLPPSALRGVGAFAAVVRDPAHPFVILAPVCPAEAYWTWHAAALLDALDALPTLAPVDPDRRLVTGLSMGGYGAWKVAARAADRLAAAVPICGGGRPEWAPDIGRLPVWTFHGTHDEVVEVQATMAMVDALRAAGGDVRFTLYEGGDHDAWTATYANPEVWAWMAAQRRSARA